MSVNFSTVSRIVKAVNNPALPIGTLIEEVPADIGRSVEGYKRGGIIEGSEKLRKELMSAGVWMFGIPAFKKAGDLICENVLKIPMNIDYSNASQGRDSVKDSINYLTGKLKETNLDISELKKYGKKFEGIDPNSLIKKVQGAKKITSIAAVLLNCALMGVVLPKVNQAITKKKLQKTNEQQPQAVQVARFDTLEEFKNKTAKTQKPNNNEISFKGLVDSFVYNVENNNIFRLISTDVPMIGGRVATSRNKYEGLECVLMDGLSVYFYNFSSNHIQKLLRKATNTPDISPTIAELLAKVEPEKLKEVMGRDLENCSESIAQLFKDENLAKNIYKEATYGKYGKINRFVKDSELKEADKGVISFLNYIKKQATDTNPLIKDGNINTDLIKKAVTKTRNKNALFLALGLAASAVGLGVLIPKFTFWVTRKLTGKSEFTGTANFEDDKANVNKA